MIQNQSRLLVADNTGARELLCLRIIPGVKKNAISGDSIVAVVKRALPIEFINLNIPQKANLISSKHLIKKSEIVLALIIRLKTYLNRENGFFVSFDNNSAILIKPDSTPRGTRIFGPISKEIRKKKLTKIIALATEIV